MQSAQSACRAGLRRDRGTSSGVGRWAGSSQFRKKQRAADGLEELTGCCDWRSDGGPEPGACVKGAGSARSLGVCVRVCLRALLYQGSRGGGQGGELI